MVTGQSSSNIAVSTLKEYSFRSCRVAQVVSLFICAGKYHMT